RVCCAYNPKDAGGGDEKTSDRDGHALAVRGRTRGRCLGKNPRRRRRGHFLQRPAPAENYAALRQSCEARLRGPREMFRARDLRRWRPAIGALRLYRLLRCSALRTHEPRISFEKDQEKVTRELLKARRDLLFLIAFIFPLRFHLHGVWRAALRARRLTSLRAVRFKLARISLRRVLARGIGFLGGWV